MCTVMFFRETLPAEKRSLEDSQKAADQLMEYDRQLAVGASADEGMCKAPLFEDQPGGICSMPWGRGGPVYVCWTTAAFGQFREERLLLCAVSAFHVRAGKHSICASGSDRPEKQTSPRSGGVYGTQVPGNIRCGEKERRPLRYDDLRPILPAMV